MKCGALEQGQRGAVGTRAGASWNRGGTTRDVATNADRSASHGRMATLETRLGQTEYWNERRREVWDHARLSGMSCNQHGISAAKVHGGNKKKLEKGMTQYGDTRIDHYKQRIVEA